MSGETAFIDLLRALATSPAARGLQDDAAVLEVGGAQLVLTSDTLVEGVHFLSDDPPGSIGWKLAAVNLSDLASKGARPLACLMNYALSGDGGWDAAFLDGLRFALEQFGMPLVGGDTVAMPEGAPRSFTLTAIGESTSGKVPSRVGARAGDILYVTGSVGDSGAGLKLLQAGERAPASLVEAYRRPQPRIAEGQALAGYVSAMMDVSDGLLIDASRLAQASGLAVTIDTIPLSDAFFALHGRRAQIDAATSGDDYELLFAASEDALLPVPATAIGRFSGGSGLSLILDGQPVPLPPRTGYQHHR
ncbi:MAG: thiamine-phosphate kinase [Sphingobium sp.]